MYRNLGVSFDALHRLKRNVAVNCGVHFAKRDLMQFGGWASHFPRESEPMQCIGEMPVNLIAF